MGVIYEQTPEFIEKNPKNLPFPEFFHPKIAEPPFTRKFLATLLNIKFHLFNFKLFLIFSWGFSYQYPISFSIKCSVRYSTCKLLRSKKQIKSKWLKNKNFRLFEKNQEFYKLNENNTLAFDLLSTVSKWPQKWLIFSIVSK